MRYITVVVALFCVSCSWNAERAKRDYMAQGDALYEKGNYIEADLAYRRAIQKDQQFVEAHYKRGLVQIKRGNYDRAVQFLRRAAQLSPDHVESRVALGDIYLMAYVSDAARPKPILDQLTATISQLKAKAPDTYDTLRLSGYMALAQGNRKEGLRHLQGADFARPNQPRLVLTICENLVADNDMPAAEKRARELMIAHKTFGEIYDFLYFFYRSANRPADAEAVLEAKVANNPIVPGYRVQLAAHYASVGRGSETTTILQKLIDNPKDFPGAWRNVGDYYLAKQNWAEALRHYREGLAREPNSKEIYQSRIVETLLFQQNKTGAMAEMETILAQNPKLTSMRLLRASVRLSSDKPQEIDLAVRELQELVAATPEDATLHYHLGRAWIAKRDLRSAQASMREASKRRKDVSMLPAHLALAEVTLDLQQFREALQITNDILAMAPDNRWAYLLKATALVGMESYLVARPVLERLLKETPDFVEAKMQYALLNLAEKRFPEAEAQMRQMYKPGQADIRILRGLTELHMMKGKGDEAYKLALEESRRTPPPAVDQRQLLADLAVRTGRFDVAEETLKALIAENVPSGNSHFQLSGIYYAKGDLPKAVSLLEESRKLNPNDPRVLLMLGSLYERSGRLKDAQQLYRETLRIDSNSAAGMNNLAFNIAESGGDLDEALVLAKRAVQRAPTQPHFSDTVAWIYLKKKMTNAAVQVFENLVQQHPDDPTFRYHLGAALLEKGELSRAKSELTAALTKEPGPHQANQIRILLAAAK